MSSFTDVYEVTSEITDNGIDFFFLSEGKRDVFKAIDYSYFLDHEGEKVYNLAFGDYNARTDDFADNAATNNGDPYRVYHTVLATIPYFFRTYGNAMLMVRGSDSTKQFQENCRFSCKRSCPLTLCRKAHRRITIYRNYIDKNFKLLNKEYEFFGNMSSDVNQILIERYVKGKKYLMVFLKKRKLEV